jgi:hypothetical protein
MRLWCEPGGFELVEYRILGPLAVLAGGHELNLGGPKQRRILAPFTAMGMPAAGELAHQVRSSVARPETDP